MLLGCLVRHFSLLTSLQCRKQIVAPPPSINFINYFIFLEETKAMTPKLFSTPPKKKKWFLKYPYCIVILKWGHWLFVVKQKETVEAAAIAMSGGLDGGENRNENDRN